MEVTKDGLKADFSKVQWRKSSASGVGSDNCVEVAFAGDLIGVRDSKDKDGPKLVFTKAEWKAFVKGVKQTEFDLKAK